MFFLQKNKVIFYIYMILLIPIFLFACSKTSHKPEKTNTTEENLQIISNTSAHNPPQPSIDTAQTNLADDNPFSVSTMLNKDEVLVLDWEKIDSGIQPVIKENFAYSIALDSQPVQSYAEFFKVTPQEAQHSLTIGTASNEVLSPLLDQLGYRYVSHQLTDGKDVKLIVHTTSDVQAGEYKYVFANGFAKGLVLPVIIINDGSK